MGVKDDIIAAEADGVGQGELYSPDHGIKINTRTKLEEGKEEKMVMGLAVDNIKRNLAAIKERLLEKLAAAAVPPDALENARHFLESVVRDVTVAAHGLTKDALLRVKIHLAELLPSISPNITTKMVDDAEEEANGHGEGEGRQTKEGSKALLSRL